jgi:hypothetical protein
MAMMVILCMGKALKGTAMVPASEINWFGG